MLGARLLLACATMLSVTIPTSAFAWDTSFTGKVTMIERSYMLAKIVFTSDRGAIWSVAGAMLTWNFQGATADERIANGQAVFSAPQTAKATNGNVDIFVNTTNCTVEFLHLL